jgi:uncharacterized membrane protein (TIGR02234 family)
MTSRRELSLALGLAVLGSVLCLWGLSLPWAHYELGHQLTIDAARVKVSGTSIRPDVRAAAFVGLAGTLALAATRSWGRIVVGGLLAAAGAFVAVRCGLQLRAKGLSFVLDYVAAHGGCPSSSSCGSGDIRVVDAPRLGEALAAVGGLALMGSGLLALVHGRRWARLGSSYEAPGAAPEPPVTEKAVWDALDRGDDPTV